MSDEFSDAFEELLDAQEETRGRRITVKIEGKPVDAIIEDMTTEEVVLMGGNGDAGGFRAICPVSRFRKPPKHGDAIEAERRSSGLVILKIGLRNDVVYELTAGDPIPND